jgi:sulfide:quinone oxidoreductase
MAFKKITSSFSAAPQLTRNDVAAAAQAGYHSIISSRPDGEEPGQPSAHEMARIAEEHGLGFAHVPIVPGKATDADADRMKEALASLPGPTLGFCRSGTRAATLWALAEADHADPGDDHRSGQGSRVRPGRSEVGARPPFRKAGK